MSCINPSDLVARLQHIISSSISRSQHLSNYHYIKISFTCASCVITEAKFLHIFKQKFHLSCRVIQLTPLTCSTWLRLHKHLPIWPLCGALSCLDKVKRVKAHWCNADTKPLAQTGLRVSSQRLWEKNVRVRGLEWEKRHVAVEISHL